MTEDERGRQIGEGLHVLRRRELEEYLYDPEVLRMFLESQGCGEIAVTEVLKERDALVNNQSRPANIKDVSRPLFEAIRRITRLSNLGNSRQEFALQFLVPARSKTQNMFEELREDVFRSR